MTTPTTGNPLSPDDVAKGKAEFSVGPFKFNVPLVAGESPTLEITILDKSGNIGKGMSGGVNISIKNIGFIEPELIQNSFRQTYDNNLKNSLHHQRAAQRQREAAEKKKD